MSIHAILMPMFVQVGLTFVLLFWMGALRLRAIRQGGYVRHRVFFADEATAIAAGYRPCGTCMRAEYAAWKVRAAADG